MKTRIFFGVLTVAILVSVFFTFNRAYVSRDYEIISITEDIAQ